MARSKWAQLDENLLAVIFKALDPATAPAQVARCRLVCKSWKRAAALAGLPFMRTTERRTPAVLHVYPVLEQVRTAPADSLLGSWASYFEERQPGWHKPPLPSALQALLATYDELVQVDLVPGPLPLVRVTLSGKHARCLRDELGHVAAAHLGAEAKALLAKLQAGIGSLLDSSASAGTRRRGIVHPSTMSFDLKLPEPCDPIQPPSLAAAPPKPPRKRRARKAGTSKNDGKSAVHIRPAASSSSSVGPSARPESSRCAGPALAVGRMIGSPENDAASVDGGLLAAALQGHLSIARCRIPTCANGDGTLRCRSGQALALTRACPCTGRVACGCSWTEWKPPQDGCGGSTRHLAGCGRAEAGVLVTASVPVMELLLDTLRRGRKKVGKAGKAATDPTRTMVCALFVSCARVLAAFKAMQRLFRSDLEFCRAMSFPQNDFVDPVFVSALPTLQHVTKLSIGTLHYVAPSSNFAGAMGPPAHFPTRDLWLYTLLNGLRRLPGLRTLAATVHWGQQGDLGARVEWEDDVDMLQGRSGGRGGVADPPGLPSAQLWTSPLENLQSLKLNVQVQHPHCAPESLLGLRQLSALTALSLVFARADDCLEPGSFTARCARDLGAMTQLSFLSLTVMHCELGQVAAGYLAQLTQLTGLELMRVVTSVPMDFFEWHTGVEFLAALPMLARLKLNEARCICPKRVCSWDQLASCTGLRQLVMSGAHLDWADYSPLSCLRNLSELQLAQCSGHLPVAWFGALPHLRRLYLKGNGSTLTKRIGLQGAPRDFCSALSDVHELYLGLCAFVHEDGAANGGLDVPCVSMLTRLTGLQAVNLTGSPFLGTPRSHLPAALRALCASRALTKLRLGRPWKLGDAGWAVPPPVSLAAVCEGVQSPWLRELTLDAAQALTAVDLRRLVMGCRGLVHLRLLGSSSCTQADIAASITLLSALSRLLLGPEFVTLDVPLPTAHRSRPPVARSHNRSRSRTKGHKAARRGSHEAVDVAATGTAAGEDEGDRQPRRRSRSREAGASQGSTNAAQWRRGGGLGAGREAGRMSHDVQADKRLVDALDVLAAAGHLKEVVVKGKLQEALRSQLRGRRHLRNVLWGPGRAGFWDGFSARTGTSQPSLEARQASCNHAVHGFESAACAQWDSWPLSYPSDDEDYVDLKEAGICEDDVLAPTDLDSVGDIDDDAEFDFGAFYDPFHQKMLVDADSDSDANEGVEPGFEENLHESDDEGGV